MSFIDIYQLGYSEPFNITGREEVTESLELSENPSVNIGTLSGIVTSNGVKVADATVKIYDINNNSIQHTNAGDQGQYSITNIPVGSYTVVAIKEGYFLPNPLPVSIQDNKTTIANVEIQVDPNANLSAIFGITRSIIDGTPIENVTVTLFRVVEEESTQIGTVQSNANGRYLFSNLATGEYYAVATKAGYLSNLTATIDVGTKEYLNSDITLIYDPQTNTGTVSGFINDITTGLPIPKAIVALYAISGEVETIIALTRTSNTGRYLFANVDPGNYRVKATLQAEG